MCRTKVKVIATAVTGRKHLSANRECEDVVLSQRGRRWKTSSIVLADGAGSATHARIGAQFSVNLICDNAERLLESTDENPRLADSIISLLKSGLAEIATKHSVDVKQLASTLLFVCVKMKKQKLHFLAGHLGDGVIGLTVEGRTDVLSKPDNGEFVNSTTFTTSANSGSSLRLYRGVLEKPTGFILMSDGASNSLYDNHRAILAPVCGKLMDLLRRLSQKRAARALKTNVEVGLRPETTDDCSLALLYWTAGKR